mmetsp:Transcript_49921/g.93433  ORF Transcript_49921/g.93433 Transcript_49921/m.93433 type:complete len:222 (+) Transcript_49921:1-666(+)
MLKALLVAFAAGSAGADSLASKAQAARKPAEARCAAAAANIESLASAHARQARSQRTRSANALPAFVSPHVPSQPSAPARPPSSAVEGIQRWVDSVRQTGAVAASGNDTDWRRQLDVLRAGLTGTAVCLSPEKGSKLPHLPSLSANRSPTPSHQEECPICLEPIWSVKQDRAPLPCGHTFHVTCLSQWLQKHPCCPMCRHSPFMPITKQEGPQKSLSHRNC